MKFHEESFEFNGQKYDISDLEYVHIAVKNYVHKKPIWIRLRPNPSGTYIMEFSESEIPFSPMKGEVRLRLVWTDGDSLANIVQYYGWCKYLTLP